MKYLEKEIEISTKKLKVSYIDEGSKEASAIIFIHGFPFNKSMWKKQLASLMENNRVIAYDVRGHGNSDAGNDIFSIELFVNDLLSFMDALKIDQAALCGLSMGGYIALNAIENYPKRFIALILCDTNCKADTLEAKENRMKTIRDIKENGVEQYANESLKKLFAPESFSKHSEEVEYVREMIINTPKQSLYNTLKALSERIETCSKLIDIRLPVLILVGKEDKIIPSEAALFMHQKMKGSSLQIIESAGHVSNLENPDQFNEHLKRFIISTFSKA
ncbi:MAG: alpha/beta hydrolase [Bacteroidetes bacterium HGW-Bacteroidetes-1]|jgi:pimeloyl-ACP methyl ester carboxylesterase|nr:MAG: alpha/beta hydrolase [Bacteroidetes bacterium HGW-Bacteroidetes-1]